MPLMYVVGIWLLHVCDFVMCVVGMWFITCVQFCDVLTTCRAYRCLLLLFTSPFTFAVYLFVVCYTSLSFVSWLSTTHNLHKKPPT